MERLLYESIVNISSFKEGLEIFGTEFVYISSSAMFVPGEHMVFKQSNC